VVPGDRAVPSVLIPILRISYQTNRNYPEKIHDPSLCPNESRTHLAFLQSPVTFIKLKNPFSGKKYPSCSRVRNIPLESDKGKRQSSHGTIERREMVLSFIRFFMVTDLLKILLHRAGNNYPNTTTTKIFFRILLPVKHWDTPVIVFVT